MHLDESTREQLYSYTLERLRELDDRDLLEVRDHATNPEAWKQEYLDTITLVEEEG